MCLRCQSPQLTANKAHFPQYFCNMLPYVSTSKFLFLFPFQCFFPQTPYVRNVFTTDRHATAWPLEHLPLILSPLNTLFELEKKPNTHSFKLCKFMSILKSKKAGHCHTYMGSSCTGLHNIVDFIPLAFIFW